MVLILKNHRKKNNRLKFKLEFASLQSWRNVPFHGETVKQCNQFVKKKEIKNKNQKASQVFCLKFRVQSSSLVSAETNNRNSGLYLTVKRQQQFSSPQFKNN